MSPPGLAHAGDDADARRKPTPEIPAHLRLKEQKIGVPVAARVGQVPPEVELATTGNKTRRLPAIGRVSVVVYEDKDAGNQNPEAHEIIRHLGSPAANRDRLVVVPVADIEAFNFWPARHFALQAVRAEEKKSGETFLVDLKGALRKAWGLKLHKSGILVLDPDGVLVFADEGPLPPSRIADLRACLVAQGLELPPNAVATPPGAPPR